MDSTGESSSGGQANTDPPTTPYRLRQSVLADCSQHLDRSMVGLISKIAVQPQRFHPNSRQHTPGSSPQTTRPDA